MSIINYFRDTKSEMKHVTWPSNKQAVAYTIIVIFIALSVAILLGAFDYVFALLIQKII